MCKEIDLNQITEEAFSDFRKNVRKGFFKINVNFILNLIK